MPSPKYMFEKPRQDVVPRPRQAPNQFCRKATYAGGKLTECHKPTAGRTYCPDCQTHLVTMLDRPANQPSAQGFIRGRRKVYSAPNEPSVQRNSTDTRNRDNGTDR